MSVGREVALEGLQTYMIAPVVRRSLEGGVSIGSIGLIKKKDRKAQDLGILWQRYEQFLNHGNVNVITAFFDSCSREE